MSFEFENYISFINGNVGVYSVASVIYDSLGERGKAMEFVENVKEVFNKPMTDKVDYDDGIPGFLYALDFLETYYGQPLFDREDVVRFSTHLFEYGF